MLNRVGGWAQVYAENRGLVWGAVVVFLLQSIITVALILSRARRRRVEAELRASRANLERAQEIARMGSWEREVATGG